MSEMLLTQGEVINLLRVSRRTLDRWRKQNPPKLRAYRIGPGRFIRYKFPEVEALVRKLPVAR